MKTRFGAVVVAAMLALQPASAPAQALSAASLEALRAADGRLAGIAYRLTTANAPLCRDLQPTPGWALHAIDQYAADMQPTARGVFGFEGPVAVEAIVPGAPAARAGVRANDAIVAAGGKPIPRPGRGDPSSVTRDAATALIAAEPAAAPLRLDLLRGGKRSAVTLAASAGCRAAFEILLGPGMTAESDGRIVQIGVRFFERYSDDQIAVVVAHELAHIVLRHRARLEAAGVTWGLLSELGRNGRLFRQTESDADLLGVHLLRNAGYDPASAPRFWRDHGGDIDGGVFRSRTHPSSKARADAIAAEIARIPAGAPSPFVPPVLATRDQPLD